MRNNYSYFSIVSLMDQIWKFCGRNFSPYWNVQHPLSVFHWSEAWYTKDFFPSKRQRSCSCLVACPDPEDGHLTLGKCPSSISLPILLLLNLFHTGVAFCFYAWGESTLRQMRQARLYLWWGKPWFSSSSFSLFPLKQLLTGKQKEEWITERRRVLSFYLCLSFALFFTLNFMFKNK